jgi:hypothetical protein
MAQTDLQALVNRMTTIAQGRTLEGMIQGLDERLSRIRQARDTRPPRATFENRATTSVATEFCAVVGDVLRSWRYPNLGSITFDTEKADLVIGGEDRANKGKGYRAITYAAFVIGMMKYCRIKGIPHPGVVVLDTPLNPFRGPDASNSDERIADDLKTGFYEYLANDASGDQVIIMENEEPPVSVQSRVNYHHFSKNERVGRYGFFPVVSAPLGS